MDNLLKKAKKMLNGGAAPQKSVKKTELKKDSLLSPVRVGRRSGLPTDTQWDKIRPCAFDRVQRDMGHVEGILSGLDKLAARRHHNAKFKIR